MSQHSDTPMAVWYLTAFSVAAGFTLLIPMLLLEGEWAGWLLFYFSFLVIAAFRDVRRSPVLAVAFVSVLLGHSAVAFVNAYHHTVVGADRDAIRFYRNAVLHVQENNTTWELFQNAGATYEQVLATVFRITGTTSLFLAEQLSCLAVVFACAVLIRLTHALEQDRHPAFTVLVFGMLPSSLVLCSVTLREAFQSLLTLLLADGALRLRERPGIGRLAYVCVIGTLLAATHHGLAVFALFGVVLSVTFAYRHRARRYRHLRRIAAVAVVGALIAVALSGPRFIGALGAVQSGEILEEVSSFRERVPVADARTNYSVSVDASSFLSLAISMPAVFFYYLFAPFPWQVQTVGDLLACGEGILRLLLIYFSLRAWRASVGEQRKRLLFMIALFAFAEALWSLGTVNWGTAVRHHLPAYGLLVATGAPGLIVTLRRMASAILRLPVPPSSRARKFQVANQ